MKEKSELWDEANKLIAEHFGNTVGSRILLFIDDGRDVGDVLD